MADVLPLQYFLNQDDPLWNQRLGGIGGASLGALWDRAVANNATQGKSPGTVGKDPYGRYVGPATGGPVYPGMPGGVPTLPWQQIPMRPRTDVMGTTWPMLGQGAASQASQTALGGAQIAPEGAMSNFALQDMGALPPDRYAGTKQFDLTGEESGVNGEMLTPNTTQIDSGMPEPTRTQLTGRGWGQYPGYTPPQQQGGGISQALGQDNNAGLWGLVAAGLGILANNTGHYGQAGPAIGKGGLIGLDTFLQQRQVATQNAAQQQQLAIAQQEIEQRGKLNAAQIGNYKSEEELRLQQSKKFQRDALAADQLQNAYQAALAGVPPEKAAETLRDPNFHYALGARLNAVGNPAAGQLAFKQGDELAKLNKAEWTPHEVTTGDMTSKTMLIDKNSGKVQQIDGALPSNKSPVVSLEQKINSYLPASEEAQQELMKETRQSYNVLKNAPVTLQNIEKAKQLIGPASPFVGAGGDTRKDIAKWFNNNLGTNINPDAVANAEELQSRLFQQIMENLRKMDAQPTERQQTIMQQSLGSLTNDPKALPRVLDMFSEIVRQKVDIHNRDVNSAIRRGVQFPYDPLITLPEATVGKPAKRYNPATGKIEDATN